MLGISQCYLKQFTRENDFKHINHKDHHHTSYEIHIINSGHNIYEIDNQFVKVEAGSYLLISPLTKHRFVEASLDTAKHSMTFTISENRLSIMNINEQNRFFLQKTPKTVDDNINYICSLKKTPDPFTSQIISNRVFECIVSLLRPVGVTNFSIHEDNSHEDLHLALAKQFVRDNVEQVITVSDLAAYCRLSTKHLTRLFQQKEDISASEYIRKQKCLHIEKLLSDSSLSLREISEKMNFNNEYYFNTFFKKYAGMSPGAYRRSIL